MHDVNQVKIARKKKRNLSSKIRNYLYLKFAKQFLMDESAVGERQRWAEDRLKGFSFSNPPNILFYN